MEDEKKKQYRKEYRQKNKEKIKKQMREYHLKHKDRKKEYNEKNKEKIKKEDQTYKEKNKEKLKIYREEYRKNNIERIRKRMKNYCQIRRKQDINFKLKEDLRRRLRYCLKVYGNGKEFPSSKYGIHYKKIIEHLKPSPKDISKYHIDHIKPLCSFDLTNSKEVAKAFAPENHQWLLARENMRKGGRY